MIRKPHVPDRGDLVWITLNPAAGQEQPGRRPALVLRPRSYNRKTGLCMLCPATRRKKGYAFEVDVKEPDGTTGRVLSDQLRNVDWRARQSALIHRVLRDVLEAVIARVEALIIDPDT